MAQHAPLVAVDSDPLGTLRQPSVAKSIVMGDLIVIGRRGRIRPPGIVRGVPSFANWLAVRS
jgi:hypothetical protein